MGGGGGGDCQGGLKVEGWHGTRKERRIGRRESGGKVTSEEKRRWEDVVRSLRNLLHVVLSSCGR